VGRFGGEEFLILLRDTPSDNALRVAERLRAAVEAAAIPVTDSPEPVRITMSFGVACFPDPCQDPQRLLYYADMAVYRSKLNGRNRVSLAAPSIDDAQPEQGDAHQPLEALVLALSAREAGFDSQTLRVTALCLALAREMGIAEGSPQWRDIEAACLLHDVGKVAIPGEVLNKRGPLGPEDWKYVRQHPQTGWEMLRQVETLRGAAEIVRAHHEQWGGGGYPYGLRCQEIPLGARIFAVVDAFAAITSDRPYRAARSEAVAVEEIRRNRGSQFDPQVVDLFLRVLGRPVAAESERTASGDRNGGAFTPSLPVDAG
ncbi:MAG: diguanylate cyclase, partial [Chloroflexi bacterium]|nr:diguanylate cyclase [Chloroflexota bacterium]